MYLCWQVGSSKNSQLLFYKLSERDLDSSKRESVMKCARKREKSGGARAATPRQSRQRRPIRNRGKGEEAPCPIRERRASLDAEYEKPKKRVSMS